MEEFSQLKCMGRHALPVPISFPKGKMYVPQWKRTCIAQITRDSMTPIVVAVEPSKKLHLDISCYRLL